MKINKRDLRHWVYIFRGSLWALLSVLWRLFRSKRCKIVILYGHKFNGNLKAFADYHQGLATKSIELYYATLDPNYYKELISSPQSVPILNLNKFRDMIKVAQSEVVMIDHGTGVLIALHKLTNIKFINVWHGIGFKAEKAESFRSMDNYAEHWVTSPDYRKMWVDKFGRHPSKVKVTGYARVDQLVKGEYKTKELKKKYSIGPEYKKIILLAPTWQISRTKSVVPFGVTPENFFSALDKLAARLNSLIIFRAHLNTSDRFDISKFKNIKIMSHRDYPLAEEFLAITDILVSDWSSIVFDFLVLRRPTIFLDVPNHTEGFAMDSKYRFGAVAKDLPELLAAINKYATHPRLYMKEHGKEIEAAEKVAYANTLDGQSSHRYLKRLESLLEANT